MSEPPNGTDSIGLVPESLLAIAKDARYVDECKALVLRILQHAFSTTLSRDAEERWEPTAGLLSSLLYTVLVLARKKRTAGMEVCGIEFSSDDGPLLRWKLVTGAVISAVWIYGIRSAAAAAKTTAAAARHYSSESLTGAQRRRVFDEQRREMMQRASTAAVDAGGANTTVTSPPPSSNTSTAGSSRTIAERLRSLIQSAAQSLDPAIAAHPEGPHAIPDTTGSSNRVQTVGMWLLRLHLAIYCVHGQFPSWTHRLLYRKNPLRLESGQSQALVHRPDSARIVGLLLLTQAACTLVQAVSRKAIHWWVDSTIAATPTTSATKSQPCSVRFEGLPAEPVDLNNTTSNHHACCAICQQVRRFPACPVACGHVFCWHCLQQWVASNAAACPLCRKACTASDIMLLHNYDGPTTRS
jgi:Ring finger domain